MTDIKAIDLFCGAGGLTHGLIKAGISVIAGIDCDPDCKYAYEHNNQNKFIESDISLIKSDDIRDLFGKDYQYSLLAGCAPCQPFSKYRFGEDTTKDKKWKLLYEFSRFLSDCKPDLVTMENVPELETHQVFKDFITGLKGMNYYVSHSVVNCMDYGIPQNRKRLVLLASLHGDVKLIPPTHNTSNYVTVKDAISHLPPLASGETNTSDRLHISSKLNSLNMKRIKQSKPGGTWRDWDKELLLECHKKDSGKSYPSVYGRMKWTGQAPTMTTLCYGYGNGRFGHPEQDRAISLREAAIFQSFPENYSFYPTDSKLNISSIGRLIGNAVPVKLGEVIGISFKKHLESLN